MKRLPLIKLAKWVLFGCFPLAIGATHVSAKQPPQQAPASAAKPATDPVDISKADLSEFAWLVGKWQGNWGPRIAEQVWLGSKAGEMPGLFRVVENDKTLVLELYSLLQTPLGIELRIRHFTPLLVPWEQSAIAILRLTTVGGGAVFENPSSGQPGKQTLIRIDADTYISRTEIASENGNKQVTEIRFHRVKEPVEETAPPQKKKTKSH
ncbi:MAG TPA: DUF6265 family protein [Candidatus Acidoferrales bacterium]|jgi:hypothetical protein|nr:DUF6265 family protein [Candidatus Acidoferrales bacterium]